MNNTPSPLESLAAFAIAFAAGVAATASLGAYIRHLKAGLTHTIEAKE